MAAILYFLENSKTAQNHPEIDQKQQPLLSGTTCANMGLITVHIVNNVNMSEVTVEQDIFTEYKGVFEGLGCFPGEYHLVVDPNVTPVKTLQEWLPFH